MKKSASILAMATFSISAAPAFADEIRIMAGDLPPMIFADGTGREAEVIESVLGHCGHEAVFVVQPFVRHWNSYSNGEGDAVTTVPPGMPMDGGQTQPYVFYHNGIVSLEAAELEFSALADTAGLRIASFGGASDIIPGLKDFVPQFGDYREVSDQEVQNKLLFGGRVDGILGDGMLFAEYTRQIRAAGSSSFDANQALEFQGIFAPTPYAMNFRDPALAADFDRCLAEQQANGSIAAINEKWVAKYSDSLGENYLTN